MAKSRNLVEGEPETTDFFVFYKNIYHTTTVYAKCRWLEGLARCGRCVVDKYSGSIFHYSESNFE